MLYLPCCAVLHQWLGGDVSSPVGCWCGRQCSRLGELESTTCSCSVWPCIFLWGIVSTVRIPDLWMHDLLLVDQDSDSQYFENWVSGNCGTKAQVSETLKPAVSMYMVKIKSDILVLCIGKVIPYLITVEFSQWNKTRSFTTKNCLYKYMFRVQLLYSV